MVSFKITSSYYLRKLNYKTIILLAAVFGGLGVILGAFGAHALTEQLSAKQLSTFKTGNTYQFYHALLLLFIGILYKLQSSKWLRLAVWTCVAGIFCFSGSLYLLSCKDILNIGNTSIIGPITPIGGLFFVMSWVFLIVHIVKKNG